MGWTWRRKHGGGSGGDVKQTSNLPDWEKDFCSIVGRVTWQKLVETKMSINMGLENKIVQWNDSAGKQAFVDAKCRFWAEINNLQYDVPLPGPDIYIDDVDWNGADVDPELIWDPERSRGPQETPSQEHEVVILGLNSRNLDQMRMSSTGWGDEFEENAPQNNADYQENPRERKASAVVGGGGWWDNGGWKKWGNNNYSGGHKWKNNDYYRGDGYGAYRENFKSGTWSGWKGYGQHGGGGSKSNSGRWKPWRYRGGDRDQKGGEWWRNGSWGKRNRVYGGEHGGGWYNSNSGEWKPLRNGGGDCYQNDGDWWRNGSGRSNNEVHDGYQNLGFDDLKTQCTNSAL